VLDIENNQKKGHTHDTGMPKGNNSVV